VPVRVRPSAPKSTATPGLNAGLSCFRDVGSDNKKVALACYNYESHLASGKFMRAGSAYWVEGNHVKTLKNLKLECQWNPGGL
jgi:hypothetical protein